MQKINSEQELLDAIHRLEQIQLDEINKLKAHFHITDLKLNSNGVRNNALVDAAKSIDIKEVLINSGLGLATGYLSKKIFVGTSKSPIRRLLGNVIMIFITNAVSNNPESIKTLVERMVNVLKISPRSDRKVIHRITMP